MTRRAALWQCNENKIPCLSLSLSLSIQFSNNFLNKLPEHKLHTFHIFMKRMKHVQKNVIHYMKNRIWKKY